MRSLDTSVLVRYLVRDDAEQVALADEVIAAGCFVSTTVLIETVWVMASRFRIARSTIAKALTALLRLPGLVTEDDTLIAWAVGRFGAGADFADMIHLVTSRSAVAFVTFDRALAKCAGEDTPLAIETLA